ncbi:MAG: DUF493 domain-containing protein [Pseudomonadales bacterium]
MTEPVAPKIEFPCEYPIKVIGDAVPGFLDEILGIVSRYDETVTSKKVKERPSSKGKYTALTIKLWATGEPQLKSMFAELKACTAVRMVL